MKKTLTILMLCGVVGGYAQTTPPYAASTKTWVIGEQTWSDHINVPECNKTSFESGTIENPKADCRNNSNYYYLYSWEYVRRNASTLCPAPWRVPTKDSFIKLAAALSSGDKNVISDWGAVLGGTSNGSGTLYYQGLSSYYWSSSAYSSTYGYYASVESNYFRPQGYAYKRFGFSLRCVR
jgi:hypothetical protein